MSDLGVSKKLTFGLRPEKWEGNSVGYHFLGSENSKCKGPETGKSLAWKKPKSKH